jgi:glycosyltransferase involved in cell wall biosynthesis
VNWPKISIVTPSLNQAEFLEAAIQSVLSQNYPNLEYIIIDGGSTDGSPEIIKKYEKHLHYWCSETDGGQYEAINKGFAYSTGKIMSWLNSDDMYCPWALRTVGSIMSELPKVEWLTSLRPGWWDWRGFCLGFGSIPGYSREAFLDGRYLPSGVKTGIPIIGSPKSIQQESTFWRRSLWEKAGSRIPTEFSLAGDFDLWSRFYAHADLYGTPSPLGGFRCQRNQRTHEREKYVAEAEKSLLAMRELFHWSPKFSRTVYAKLKLDRIPKIRNLCYGTYRANKVIREKIDSPDGSWHIEEYSFR